jgi:hypothetical protein
MNSRRRPVWPIAVLLFLLLFAIPHLAWRFTPLKRVGVVVVNKTLPHPAYREHERVTWWLTHRRVASPRGDANWDVARDFVGFNPATRTGTDLTSQHLRGARLVYIADSYGVYTADYEQRVATDSLRAAVEHTQKIYGGMQLAEVEALELFSRAGGHIVAEFNTLEDPTSGTEAGARLGALLGVEYQRWLGRWYADLSSLEEIPRWMRERHQRKYGRPWDRVGPGIVVFSEVDDQLVVIDSSHFTAQLPVTLETHAPADPLTANIRPGLGYWYWFSAVRAIDDANVLASWQLNVDSTAKAELAAAGFSHRLPAIVRRPGLPLRVYVTGDIADVGWKPPPLLRTRFLDWLGRWNVRQIRPGVQRRFWWNVTLPFWDAVLLTVPRD